MPYPRAAPHSPSASSVTSVFPSELEKVGVTRASPCAMTWRTSHRAVNAVMTVPGSRERTKSTSAMGSSNPALMFAMMTAQTSSMCRNSSPGRYQASRFDDSSRPLPRVQNRPVAMSTLRIPRRRTSAGWRSPRLYGFVIHRNRTRCWPRSRPGFGPRSAGRSADARAPRQPAS